MVDRKASNQEKGVRNTTREEEKTLNELQREGVIFYHLGGIFYNCQLQLRTPPWMAHASRLGQLV